MRAYVTDEEPYAYGALGLTPDALWAMTPREYGAAKRGRERERERDLEALAWQTAHLLQPWSKRRITPKDLLGRGSGAGTLDLAASSGAKIDRLWARIERDRKARERGED
ncbi:MAG: phage tail assembly chaperone [Gemmatimonadota bacterium]